MAVLMKTSMKTPMYSVVECPGSNDVVFRREKTMNYHPGNVKFQDIIESQFQHHFDTNTTQAQKEAMEIEVIQNIKKDGGRFLKWESDKGWWINMSVEMCHNLNLDIDIDVSSISTINSIPTGVNTDIDTNRNTNKNRNGNVYVNMNVKENKNVNLILNSNNSVSYTKAEKEIQSKVHYAFRDFKKKMIRTQQKQQQLQVSASSTSVFELLDRHKRRRSSNNDIDITTMKSDTNRGNNSCNCMSFFPDINGRACGCFNSNIYAS